MKTLTIQFEFPDTYDYDEVLEEVSKVEYEMSKELSWTIVGRR